MTPDTPGYELVEELGRGALGTVFLARRQATGEEVALKRIVGGAASQDPESVRRFEREARRLRLLDHPGIVRVRELLRVRGDLLIVMDVVRGGDLAGELAERPPEPKRAVQWIAAIAAALDHAHARDVVHGDLKPSNVLLAEDGHLAVADFGLSALLERQARFLARPGSPAYVAPELARGDLTVDRRADVYSLGVIAYELLVGRVPFPVDAADPYATVRAHMSAAPPLPSALVPGFPPLLEAALLWALQKQPERRPATAGELATALREALDRSPESTGLLGGARARVPAAAGDETGGPKKKRSTWRRRLVRWAVTAVLLLLAGAAGGAYGVARLAPARADVAPLQVTGVAARVQPADGTGHCPHATMHLVATVNTNGSGGTLAYQWMRPDGSSAGAERVSVAAGTRAETVSLDVSYNGSGPTTGVAALHVLSPASVYSPPVRISYACP